MAAVFLAFLTTLTFGLYAGRFGVYYDDYWSWYLYLTSGTEALVRAAASHGRPLVGFLPALAGSVAGCHRLMWMVHTANALLFFLILSRTLRGQDRRAVLAASLFAVYPLYWLRPTQIALAIDGSLFFALFSLWLCLLSLDLAGWRRAVVTVVSVLLVPAYALLYELPIGLEVVRPFLIRLRRPGPWRETLKGASPWLFTLAALAVWRLVVFRPSSDYARLHYNALKLPRSPADMAGLLLTLVTVAWDLVGGTWLFHLRTPLADSSPLDWLTVTLAVAAAIGGAVLLRESGKGGVSAPLLLGLAVVVLGQVAPLATGHAARVHGLACRWTAVSSLGAALVWVALLAPSRLGRAVLVAMIGLGSLWHVHNARAFIEDWERQRQLWWQLHWRLDVPPPGSLLVLDRAYPNAQDRENFEYELTMSAELFFGSEPALAATTLERAQSAPRREWAIRMAGRRWIADKRRKLLLRVGEGCVDVEAATPPALATVSPAPHRGLFGPEPDRGWCYQYQQARRAQQLGDDDQVIRIGEEAWARGLRPADASEWEPFREASRRARGREFPPRERY